MTPEPRASEVERAETAAVELLLCLDVEPRSVDPYRAVRRGGWL